MGDSTELPNTGNRHPLIGEVRPRQILLLWLVKE